MPVIASKLIEKFNSLSPEEQEELDRQATESLQSLLKPNFQVPLQSAFSNALESFQEAFKLSLGNFLKGCAADILKASSGTSEQYYGPALIPPSFYQEQKQPQIINMHTVYLSVSNIPVHFLFILVKRTR